jgi:hypothetical protein
MLQAALVGVALLIASTAHADRIFDLEGTATFRDPGGRETFDVSGILTLLDDGTYTLDLDGEVSSGIWLEERRRIQLFQEAPTISEFIAELNAAVGDFAVTSIVGKDKIKRAKTGDIIMRAKSAFTFRSTLDPEERRVRVRLKERLVGLLR